ncbi:MULTISPECIES: hypothetical protein [Streptomyces]|uniref:hypothetical protein n=1 Tax=Streptomyces TaxID=1883 RepID=UPI00345B9EA8
MATPAVAAGGQGRSLAAGRTYHVGAAFTLAVGNDGGLFMNYALDSPPGVNAYTPAVPIGAPGIAPPGAGVAGAIQSDAQVDAFLVDNDGRLWVTWWHFTTPGTAQRAALTPPGFAPPGAALVTGAQANDQRDVFVVGNDGILYVLWEANNSAWSQPIALTPARFAPPGAALATGRQANDQLDVFVVGNDGTLYVLWEANNSAWSQPIALTPARFAPPGAGVASVTQSTQQDFHQLDAFVVGNDGALYVTWEQNNSSWATPAKITSTGFATPGAPPSAVQYNNGYASVIVPRTDKSLCEFRVLEQFGAWTGPKTLSAPGTVPPTANSTIVHYTKEVNESRLDEGFYALINIAGTLITLLGNRNAGAQAALDAVQGLRPLTADYPGYRRQLAQWEASPTVAYLTAAGRWDEAAALADESIGLFRTLTKENPADDEVVYLLSWASIDIGSHLWGKTELQPKALDLCVKAIDNLRPLTTKAPSYRPQLADWIMTPTSDLLVASRDKQRAIALLQEAVDLYTQLNATDPSTYGPKLAAAKKKLAGLQA